MFPKGVAVAAFPFSMIHKQTGAAITTGTVNGYIKKDGGAQVAIAGTPTHDANGQWYVALTAAEMNADVIGLLFTHVDAVSVPFTIRTLSDQVPVAGMVID